MNPKTKNLFDVLEGCKFFNLLSGSGIMKIGCDTKAGQPKLHGIKHLILFLIVLLISDVIIHAQEKFEKFTVNLGLTHPVHYVPNNIYTFTIDPEIELLMNFRIFSITTLSAGFGMQYGDHVRIKEVNKLVMVDDIGLRPWKYTYHWNLNFLSIKVPAFIRVPLSNSFLDSYVGGISFGWFWKYNLTERNIPNTSNVKINRSYLDFSLGVRKNLCQADNLSISLSPFLGYLIYFSDNNDWQKNYIFSRIKFNFNF